MNETKTNEVGDKVAEFWSGPKHPSWNRVAKRGQLLGQLEASLKISRETPRQKFYTWDFWPQGNEKYRNWLAGESRRRFERGQIRRKLKTLAREATK